MSTHRHSLRGYRNTWLPLFLIGCGLLFALQLSLASAAFASVHGSLAGLPGSPIARDTAGAPTDQAFARASVSVVRLVVVYSDTNDSNKILAHCTGLGVVVKSLPGAATPNDWVLTDGALVNASQPLCVSGATEKIAQIQIYFNTTFNSKSLLVANVPVNNATITCSDSTNCNSGPALIAFQGEEVPFIDLAAPSPANTDHAVIPLTNASRSLPAASDTPAHDTDFLTPQLIEPDALSKSELGTPVIDASGHLTSLHFADASVSLTSISSLIPNLPAPPPDGVNVNWNKGIDDYYQRRYTTAQTDFHNAVIANPNFQGANDFENVANTAANPLSSASTSPSSGKVVIPVVNVSIELWQLSMLVLLFLILLVSSLWLYLRPRVERRRIFMAELADADRRAPVVAQQVEAMEAARRVRLSAGSVPANPYANSQPYPVPSPPSMNPIGSVADQPSMVPLPEQKKPKLEFDITDIRADINARQLME